MSAALRDGLSIRPVADAAGRAAFVELVYAIYADDPQFVPPLRGEARGLIGGAATNPWFLHARAAFWLAYRGTVVVGRISAQIDELVLEHMGAGTGQWGMFECTDDAAAAAALFATAEDWLRAQGMTRALGPFSLSIWDEPGLLVEGFERPPTVMMGHHPKRYAALVTAAGYTGIKDLHTYEVSLESPFPEAFERIVAAGRKSSRVRVRDVDKSRFAQEAELILSILNDAWGANWGYVPLTQAEKDYIGKKLKPIVYEDLVQIGELDGEPVAFMIALPDLNELTRDLGGRLFPFNWAKLLWRMRKPRVRRIRVPLMGVRTTLQGSRFASLLTFQLIDSARRIANERYGAVRGEIGWILEDNGPMRSIADVIEAERTRTYRIYEKAL